MSSTSRIHVGPDNADLELAVAVLASDFSDKQLKWLRKDISYAAIFSISLTFISLFLSAVVSRHRRLGHDFHDPWRAMLERRLVLLHRLFAAAIRSDIRWKVPPQNSLRAFRFSVVEIVPVQWLSQIIVHLPEVFFFVTFSFSVCEWRRNANNR